MRRAVNEVVVNPLGLATSWLRRSRATNLFAGTFFQIIIGLFLIAFIAGCAGAGPGAAPGGKSGATVLPWASGGLKIGYVNSDVIAQRLTEYRDADKILEGENRQWQSEADKMETDIRAKETEFEELRLILSPERRKTLEDELNQKRKDLYKYRQDTWFAENSRYIKRRRELMEPIDTRVTDAIYKVAEAKGLDVIFDAVGGNMVYVNPTFDVTDLVLEELQK